MDIAVGMEHEAALRYEHLANLMEGRGEVDLAMTFRELATLEHAHEAGLAAWAQREGRPEPHPAIFGWHFPETFSFDDAEAAPLSPYEALAIAVRNEERAFSFYTYVAALADADFTVRDRAEALAREELKHVAELRRLRRRAYHGEADHRPRNAALVSDVSGLRRLAWGLESGSAVLIDAAARCLEAAGRQAGAGLIAHAGTAAASQAVELGRIVGGSQPPAGSTTYEGARDSALLSPAALTPGGSLGLCERDAKEVLEIYLSVADRAKDEALLAEAQQLAEGAVARLALIRTQLRAAG
jgi:rubrerythrin